MRVEGEQDPKQLVPSSPGNWKTWGKALVDCGRPGTRGHDSLSQNPHAKIHGQVRWNVME